MPLRQFSANLLQGDEVLVKMKGAGKIQFQAAEGSPGADVMTKTGKVASTGKGNALTGGKGMANVGQGKLPVAGAGKTPFAMTGTGKGTLSAATNGGGVGQGTVNTLAKGATGKGSLSAVGAKAGTVTSAKVAAATGTIWKGTGLSLGLGLGLGAAGPVILGGALVGAGYYLYQRYKKEDQGMGFGL